MTTFNILHLTDLHYGLKKQESLFPKVRALFYKDLEILHQWVGSFDLVLFTGDLTQRGSAAEFQALQELLDELWIKLREYGSTDPVLLAVPGNHDLLRPAEELPAVLILQDLAKTEANRESVWNDLINVEGNGPYRQVVDKAFENYVSWWDACPYRNHDGKKFSCYRGILPGDFSATLEKDGIRLGIVGLNTAFLQLTGGDYQGRLALSEHQFLKACEGKADAWFEDNVDVCLLMTHHPPDWLAPDNRKKVLEGLIDDQGRFAAHFCGHMHKAHAQTQSLGWSQPRRLSLGGSLFGLETGPKGQVERIHAYSACRIEISDVANKGTIRLWPRCIETRADNTSSFDRNRSFTPDEEIRDEGTRAEEFPRLRKPRKATVEPESIPLEPFPRPQVRPDVGALPVLDPKAQFRQHFIGREGLLREFDDALEGLFARSTGRVAYVSRGGEVQIFWLYGFGGMGKSWLLRKAYTQFESKKPSLEVALIDWHLEEWHKPASMPPGNPRELFNAIAYRLAQVYGTEKLDLYWTTEQTVMASWERHRQLHDELDETVALLQAYGPNWTQRLTPDLSSQTLAGSAPAFKRLRRLERVLRNRNEWSDNPARLQKVLQDHRASQLLFDSADGGLFESWADEMEGAELRSVSRPCEILARTLRDCLSVCTKVAPLAIILDTCEILPEALHSWLRRLLCPLLDGNTPILVLIGSRQRPDPYLRAGQRGGWHGCVDTLRLRIIAFDEDVRFTIHELEEALTRAQIERPTRPLPQNPDLASVIHRVTLGVPLAFGTLLGLHWADPPSNALFELSSLEWNSEDLLDQTEAVRKVTEVVAGRFLLHLERNEEELRDITALTLLRHANTDVLRIFWPTTSPVERLRTLAQRYALLADGDLHPTVRDYLRRAWCQDRPPRIESIAQELLSALESVRPEEDETWQEGGGGHDWDLERLNLLAWGRGDDVLQSFIRFLVVLLASDQDVNELLELAAVIQPTGIKARKAHEMLIGVRWSDWRYPWDRQRMSATVEWLDKQRTSDWTTKEQACLDLVVALTLASNNRNSEAVARFEKALDAFGESVPHMTIVGRTYFTSVRDTVKELGEDQFSPAAAQRAERARIWADRMGWQSIEEWEESYYWILHNAEKFTDAEAYCRKILEAEPDNESALVYLGHILGAHSKDRGEDAEELYTAALALNDLSENLHYFYGMLLEGSPDRLEEAEREYRRALELLGNSYHRKNDRERMLTKLSDLLYRLGKRTERIQVQQSKLELSPNDSDLMNSLAWNIYITGENLDEAENLARRAIKIKPDCFYTLHTLAALLIRRGRWKEALPHFRKWLAQKDRDSFIQNWHEYLPQFGDAVQQDLVLPMADLFNGKDGDVVWQLLATVLRAIAAHDREFADLTPNLREVALVLYDQMLSPDLNVKFPDI